jgi:hypothetical protein
LINDTDVSVDAFYDEIIKHLQKLHSEALKTHPKLTRNEFNRYVQESANYNSLRSAPLDRKMRKKMRMNNKKKISDDEDLSVDMESSGGGGDKDQLVTTYPPAITSESSDLNDTTIIFDQEPDE